jgi:hypothetical protein
VVSKQQGLVLLAAVDSVNRQQGQGYSGTGEKAAATGVTLWVDVSGVKKAEEQQR